MAYLLLLIIFGPGDTIHGQFVADRYPSAQKCEAGKRETLDILGKSSTVQVVCVPEKGIQYPQKPKDS